MQVKVFEAADMAAGLRKVRKELGPDALILSTRTVKNGKLGLLGRQHLEITAAIDNQAACSEAPVINKVYSRKNAQRAYSSSQGLEMAETSSENMENNMDEITAKANKIDGESASADSKLREEFDELKGLVKNLAGELSKIHSVPVKKEITENNTLKSLEQKLLSTRSNASIEDLLLSQGINIETAKTISTFASEQLDIEEINDTEKLYEFLHTTIADILSIKTPDFLSDGKQRRIALIGPTGVGKTTTLAKIAANYLRAVSNSIALITIDTYRIAAVEQLKVYGEIMHLPVEVVITPDQLAASIQKHSDKDLILIDTAGRSHLDSVSIQELETFLTPDLEIENHVVLSATTRDSELLETLRKFDTLTVHNTIFTKIDECSSLGVLLNTQVKSNSPISFITNGQRVPEDILELDKTRLAQLIVPYTNGPIHD